MAEESSEKRSFPQFVDKRGSEWSHSEPLFSFLWDLKLFNKKTDLFEFII